MTGPRIASIARSAVVVALAAHAVLFVWVVAGRLTFPFELEWMTGSILDHVERVRQGLPLYEKPSTSWIPFLYPPLYYWICAAAGGTYVACRLVSLAALAIQLALAARVARALGADRFWAGVAAGLTLACFSYVGWWYDLERSDTLYGALALGAAALLLRAKGAPGYALAGVVLGVALLAKQQAIFYAAGAGAGLLLSMRGRDRARLADVVAFGAGVVLAAGAVVALAVLRESRWFFYYVLEMPRAHGVMLSLVPSTLVRDFALGFLLVGVTGAAAPLALRRLRAGEATRAELVFAAMLGAGFAGAVLSRLHIGGWVNVLQPWTTFASIAAAVLASRVAAARGSASRSATLVTVTIVLQLVAWGYDPGDKCPSRRSVEAHRSFAALVAALEHEGEVLVPARGHMTSARHFHTSALADAVRVDGRAPADLEDKLRARAFAAIIDDARPAEVVPDADWPPVLLEDMTGLRGLLLANYFVSEQLDHSQVSLPLPSPNLPVWVYRPRSEPLVGATTAQLRARQLEEMRLAAEVARARRSGRTPEVDPAVIEAMAAARVPLTVR